MKSSKSKVLGIFLLPLLIMARCLAGGDDVTVAEKTIKTPVFEFKWDAPEGKRQLNGIANGKVIATAIKSEEAGIYDLQMVLLDNKPTIFVTTIKENDSYQHSVSASKDSTYSFSYVSESSGQTMRVEIKNKDGDVVRTFRINVKHNLLHVVW